MDYVIFVRSRLVLGLITSNVALGHHFLIPFLVFNCRNNWLKKRINYSSDNSIVSLNR